MWHDFNDLFHELDSPIFSSLSHLYRIYHTLYIPFSYDFIKKAVILYDHGLIYYLNCPTTLSISF